MTSDLCSECCVEGQWTAIEGKEIDSEKGQKCCVEGQWTASWSMSILTMMETDIEGVEREFKGAKRSEEEHK